MFIEKTVKPYTVAHIFLGLVLILLLAITDLLTNSPSWSAPLTQNTPTAIPTPTVPVTPTANARCSGCTPWPDSNTRMDAAQGYNADLDPPKFEGLRNIPLVLAFGVADNGVIRKDAKGVQLHYKWMSPSCVGSHDVGLTNTITEFITSYDPTFLASSAIDSPTQYEQFVPFLQKQYTQTLLGTYYSAVTCVDEATSPYAESFYPASIADCHRFAQFTPASMHTRLWSVQACDEKPNRWYVNVGDPEVRARFQNDFMQSVKAIQPCPPFVFLDNVFYLKPTTDSQQGIDCRARASAGHSACRSSHFSFSSEFGDNIYFDDFLTHYRELTTRLEALGIRAILNVGTPPAEIASPGDPYTQKFEDMVDRNGIAFEHAFDINLRTNATSTAQEVDLDRKLLKQGALLVFSPTELEDKNATAWTAAMAMLIREQGQSLFVARDAYSSTLEWIQWPALYGTPGVTDTVHPFIIDARTNSVGHNWSMSRQFYTDTITREITAVHFGVDLQALKTFTVTLLAPDLDKDNYIKLYGDPKLGDWNATTNVYTATHVVADGPSVQADHFILGAGCNKIASATPTSSDPSQVCQKLIAVSIAVFR